MQTTENFLPAATGQNLGSSSQLWNLYAQNISAQRLGNMRHVALFPGATLGAQIIAAIDDLPSTGGVIDARSAEGAQTISADVFSGVTKPGMLLLGACTITLSTTQNVPSNWMIVGIGQAATVINYNQATGVAFDLNGSDHSGFYDLRLVATSGGNSATGIRIRNAADHTTLSALHIDAFASQIVLTGTNTGPARPFNTRILNCNIVNHTTVGIAIDHAVDTYLTNLLNWGVTANPTTAWGVTIDTGTSGVYITRMSMLTAGFRIRNSAPSAATYDFPPEFVFADQLIVDTVTGTDAIHFNAELATADGAGRVGKSYHFTNSWACFTQTNGMVGIAIDGGVDISFTDARVRVNRYHGIEITAGSNHRLCNCFVVANNQQNAADGDGIRVAANVNNFQIIGGASGDSIADEAGNQKYGIRVLAGTSNNYLIAGTDVSSGNDTNGVFDGGTGTNHTVIGIIGTVDNGGGNVVAAYDRRFGATARLELGDAAFYLDFKKSDANSVNLTFDTGDYINFTRTTNLYTFLVGSATIFTAAATGVQLSLPIINRTAITFANGDTTPTVGGGNLFKTANGAGTTITTFDDGINGQEITIIFTDANTTISEGGNIKLSAAFTSTADDTMKLVYDGTSWFETARAVN